MRSDPRFEDVTETTGIPQSTEGASMMYARYVRGAEIAEGRRVLEIGCGAGQGLGLLSRKARSLTGGDYSAALLREARRTYGDAIPLVRLSANRLPFGPGTFDAVLFFEASYYVPHMDQAFDEIARILAPGGLVLFVNANPERPDFIRSPHSIRYHTADDFRRELGQRGFAVTIEGAFQTEPPARGLARVKQRVLRTARLVLEALRLVPRTMRGRARLKRLVYGKLTGVPAELPHGYAAVGVRIPVGPGPVRDFKVLYALGVRS